jgi:hypothetical protein
VSESHRTSGGSGLYYYGTDIEVRLGDRVQIRRLFRKPLAGVVCYIPGLSPPVDELEDSSMGEWAIRHPDGSITRMIYLPSRAQPPKSNVFVSRGDLSGWEVRQDEEFQ